VLQMIPVRHPDSNLLPESTRLAAEGLVRVARDMPDSDQRRKMLQDAVHGIDLAAGKLHSPDLENQNLALKGIILLEDLGRPQDAPPVFEELAKRQRDLDQPDALIQVQLALCRAAVGQLEQARAVLQEVVRADSASAVSPPRPGMRRPQQPADVGWSRARYHLAELDVISGHYEEAKTTFAALAEEAPEDRLAND